MSTSLRARIARKLKGVLRVVAVRAAIFSVRIFGGKNVVSLLTAVRWVAAHRFIARSWSTLLQQSGYRSEAVRYALTLYKWKNTPWTGLNAVRSLVIAARFEAARDLIQEVSATIEAKPKDIRFVEQLLDLETVVALELGSVSSDELKGSLSGRNFLPEHYYAKAWDAHSQFNGKEVVRTVWLYCEAMGFEPEPCIYVCEVLLRPHEAWKDIQRILEEVSRHIKERTDREVQTIFTRKRKEQVDLERRLLALRALACLHAYDFQGAEELFNSPHGNCAEIQFARAFYHYLRSEPNLSVDAISRAIRGTRINRDNRQFVAEMMHFTGVGLEEAKRYPGAAEYLKRAHQIGGINFYLPEPTWRYVSLLTAFGQWGRASALLGAGLRTIWASYAKLAKVKIEKRIVRNKLIPPKAVVLGGNGVGDEILRLAFLRNFAPKNGEYGYVCDQRVHGLFSRAMPKLRPLRASRTMGPFKVSADQYLRDREGLAPWVDKVRVTREIFDREIPRYGEVMLSEDLMYAYFSSFGRYRGVKEPLFNALPERVEQARRWLATLPPGLKVGVSWRSGVPGVIRDVSYTRIDEWGPIFDATNTTFVLLQYSNSEEDIRKELELVREQFGVEIHVMPGLDLKDDFEGVVALCAELDIVVAPGTTLRETAAAAAATTWTLSTTPYLPDQWRIDQEDKHSDLIFPSMRHFTALQYESRQGAIAALGRELAEAGRVYAATANEPRERVRLSASG